MARKHFIFCIIFFGYATFTYNRKGVSFAIPKLMEEGLKNEELGLILSGQNLAYAISKFFGGIISDKLSSRSLFSAGLLLSGLTTLLFSSVSSVPLYVIIWFLNGLCQGVGWPAIAKILKNWFEPAELGTWWSMASASANFSGCLAPFLASYFIVNYGWRFSLIAVSGLAILASLISYLFIVDEPRLAPVDAPKKSSKKKNKDESKHTKKAIRANPLLLLLRHRFVWVISICYMIASSVKTSVTDWSQMYLMVDCHKSSLEANAFVSCVEFGGFFGGIAAGFLSDVYMKWNLHARQSSAKGHPRMIVALGFSFVTAVSMYAMFYLVTESTPVLFLNQLGIVIGASIYGQIAIFGVVATQSVVNEMSGTSHAIAALAANIGSIVAGLPFALIAKHYSWSHVFLVLFYLSLFTTGFMILMRQTSYRIDDLTDKDKKKKKE